MVKKADVQKIKCKKCEKELAISNNFYKSKSPFYPTGYVDICKKCVLDMVDYDDFETIKHVMQTLDIPFLYNRWEETCKNNPKNPIGNYIRMANSGINEFNGARYKDSVFGEKGKSDLNTDNSIFLNEPLLHNDERNRLIDKWGFGYNDEELYSFERKYNLLKNNYPEKTAMHTESLLTYIRYRVKEELSTAKGDVTEAQKWGQLADKASERAKLNPSQLSKADLSGGLNGFGELVRAVEQAVDIVPILPKFKKKPQDAIDWTLWCYINYVRRLKNLPDAEYEDIWKFYDERKKEYELKAEDDFEV